MMNLEKCKEIDEELAELRNDLINMKERFERIQEIVNEEEEKLI